MQYLDYQEYVSIGGVCDATAFNRNIDRACAMIDNRTQSRLECFEEIPQIVKVVCADLVDYIANNSVDYSADLDKIFEPLAVVKTENGISILYKGAMS